MTKCLIIRVHMIQVFSLAKSPEGVGLEILPNTPRPLWKSFEG